MSSCLLAFILLLLSFSSLPVASEKLPPERAVETWTILSYMSADNDLEGYLLDDLNEMEMAASEGRVNIVVQVDRNKGFDSSQGDWTDTRRYLIGPDDTEEIISTRLDDPELGELDMNDADVLREFLEWGLSSYPADHYMIILEGHGDGPVKGLLRDQDSTLGYKHMNTHQMGQAFRNAVDNTIGRPVDVVSLDICRMGMVGTAAELMDHAEYFMGSVDYVPPDGWPYDRCLPIVHSGTGSIESRLEQVIDEFYNEYTGPGGKDYISLSLIYLPEFRDSFIPAWRDLSTELFYTAYESRDLYESIIAPVDKPSGLDGINSNDRYIDALQFALYLQDDVRVPKKVKISASKVLDIQDEFDLYHRGGAGHSDDAKLLGIYMPEKWDSPSYSEMVLADITPWDDLVRLYVRELDLRAESHNWTGSRPSMLPFVLRTDTPDGITRVWVEVKTSEGFSNVTMLGSGGYFSGNLQLPDVGSLEYRYRVESIYGGTVDLPPDGMMTVRFSDEEEPPEVIHEPPVTVQVDLENGGLTFYIRDSTGIQTEIPEKVPRLEYYESGGSVYSIPLIRRSMNEFTGWAEYWGLPTGVTPGWAISYSMIVEDVLGNSARYPIGDNWTSTMGVGGRFYLDGARSSIDDHQGMIRAFLDLGMAVETHMDPSQMDDLSLYKGYILIEPCNEYPEADILKLLEFLENGGEMLLLMDPANSGQRESASLLLHDLGIAPSQSGEVNGFYAVNPGSELSSTLPSLTGTSFGSFLLSEGQNAVYYTTPPNAVLFTDRYGDGKIVVGHETLLSDEMISRTSNDQLAKMIVTYLYQNMAPRPALQIEPGSLVSPGDLVTFNMSSSFDPDGSIIEYELHISDGTVMVGPDPIVEHVFQGSGLFTISLIVHDAEEGWTALQSSIRVNCPPSTDHGISTPNAHAGEDVTFSYKGQDPEGDSYIVEWDFGDGYKVTGNMVHHAYRVKGDIMYTMRVMDLWGLESVKTGIIQIENSDPVIEIDKSRILVNGSPAEFSGEFMITLYLNEGDTITVPAMGSYDPDMGDILNFSWDMGDDRIIFGNEVAHRYTMSGLLALNLTLTDGFGGTDHFHLSIMVANRAPFAAFEWKESNGEVAFDASLSTDDEWDLSGLVYSWDLGDGEKITASDPGIKHDYTFGGTYEVVLKVTDGDGDTSTFKQKVKVSGIRIGTTALLTILAITALTAALIFLYLRKRTDPGDERSLGERGMKEVKVRSFSRPEPASAKGRKLLDPEREKGADRWK
ncbi:MAG: PKD domain-containing protein [Candidatus Thermoplasmatota archaeon]|nr:PKD domain-containing protein [Candidatus Thermoplasmatota archaeon]